MNSGPSFTHACTLYISELHAWKDTNIQTFTVIVKCRFNFFNVLQIFPQDYDKKLKRFQSKIRFLKKIKSNYENVDAPDPPSNVVLSVDNSTSLLLEFDESTCNNGAFVYKFKSSFFSSIFFMKILFLKSFK